MKDDYRKAIEDLIEETEAEMKDGIACGVDEAVASDSVLPPSAGSPVPVTEPLPAGNRADSALETKSDNAQPKHSHYGHRARVKQAADTDPDFATFSDIEMLEYLLFNTIPRIDTNELAHTLIDSFGSFSGVLNAGVSELKTIPYIGEETARMLTSVLPAARKAEVSRLRNNAVLQNTAQAVNYIAPYFQNRNVENVYLVSLSNSDRVIAVDRVSVGDTNFTTIEVKRIIETACRHKATKVVLAHNHPSGSLKPSQEDKEVTARLVIALLSINVVMVDHLIFTPEGYYSFYANAEFEKIYGYADTVFSTNLVKELELKIQNYRAGIYPKGFDDMEENAAPTAYSIGHPDPRNLKVGSSKPNKD